MLFTSIHIIYNPISTGPSKEYAGLLASQLKEQLPDVPTSLHRTKYAGHARQLAYALSKKSTNPLIVSSSGDGGYNEVINGAMRAQAEGFMPSCIVLAAGNANDHSRTVYDKPVLETILGGKPYKLDLLKITYTSKGRALERFAHSYIGFGLTPEIANELNKTDLNPINEKILAVKTLVNLQPITIERKGKMLELDSIIFTTIGEMAKVLTIATNAQPDDGKFEVALFPHEPKVQLIRRITKAAILGLKDRKSYTSYSFNTPTPLRAQLDGEVITIDSNSTVTISAQKQILSTIR